jgi:formamidopyrimidine-DNA glycosylase
MPELPEIETLARGLRKTVQGKTIKRVIVHEAKKFKGTPSELKKFVVGKKIKLINRRAKWLVLELSSGYSFIIHLKMTGQLLYQKKGKPFFLGGHSMSKEQPVYPNSHTRVTFEFTDDSTLYFQDMRKFGYVELYSAEETEMYFENKKLAKEPLDTSYTLPFFTAQLLRRKNTTIKAALLDQTVVAGIGNIYADDILFTGHVHPARRVASLTAPEIKALYKASKSILQKAIASGGTSFSHYYQLDGTLGGYWKKRKVYQRTGQPCRRCKTPIEKIRCAGRGTHFCPVCQK